MRRKLYSPQIREDLIPLVYRAAKSESVPMTTWVSQAVENALVLREQSRTEDEENVVELVHVTEVPLANAE